MVNGVHAREVDEFDDVNDVPEAREVPTAHEPHEPRETHEAHEAHDVRAVHEAHDVREERMAEPAGTLVAQSVTRRPAVHEVPAHARREESGSGPDLSAHELAETSRNLTEELLKAMGFEAKVAVVSDGNRVDVTAEVAQNDELLTGPKGEVRQALQHLLNRFLNKGEGSRYHLQLEINDFWKRRETELADVARSLADQALATNSEMVTEYLNSQERRIVHVTLREDTRVKTFALGTGMIKRVAVTPADFPERAGEEDAG